MKLVITWNAHKTHSLNHNKDKMQYHSYVVCCGACLCSGNLIGNW